MNTDVNTAKDTKWALTTRYIVGVLLVLFFVLLLYAIRAELVVVLTSAIIAYLVNPKFVLSSGYPVAGSSVRGQ
jgi:predicted PurR-regulated permease PerM